jgi:hypothetical protein
MKGEHAHGAYTRLMIFMQKKTVITALVVLLSCAAFSQSHPARYGWKERPTEKFALSNRAKRKLPLVLVPIKGSNNAMINVQLTAQFPANISVENARGNRAGSCHYVDVTELTANCSLLSDGKPKYIVIEDANQAGITEGTKAMDALNRVTLTISDYTCVKDCSKIQ